MRNSFKVAKWEIKRNLKHKSFLISLFLTPLIFIFFFTVPTLFQDSDPGNGEEQVIDVYMTDEFGISDQVEAIGSDMPDEWIVHEAESEEQALEQVDSEDNTVYMALTEGALESGQVDVHASDNMGELDVNQFFVIESVLQQVQLEEMGLSDEEVAAISEPIVFERAEAEGEAADMDGAAAAEELFPLERIVPAGFAGLILFSIVITGMMIFQSASQEKKEKVAEMVLSSLKPVELMQGKIIGYFALGMIQSVVWIMLVAPIIIWRFDLPIIDYLFVPELLVLLFIAFAGYLLFAAIFVGIGATVEDMSTSSNFQGLVFMLPWVPFILIGPILADPEGLVAQVGSFIPITAPGVLLIRLAFLEQWPWIELILALLVLLLSIWLLMKLAGKVFKTGILMYGKNATPQEIWKWIRQ